MQLERVAFSAGMLSPRRQIAKALLSKLVAASASLQAVINVLAMPKVPELKRWTHRILNQEPPACYVGAISPTFWRHISTDTYIAY